MKQNPRGAGTAWAWLDGNRNAGGDCAAAGHRATPQISAPLIVGVTVSIVGAIAIATILCGPSPAPPIQNHRRCPSLPPRHRKP